MARQREAATKLKVSMCVCERECFGGLRRRILALCEELWEKLGLVCGLS